MKLMPILLMGLVCLGFNPFAAQTEAFSHTIQWRTTSQEQIFGFNVYRASAKSGPFSKRNNALILSNKDTDTQTYTFEDTEIDPNQDYYYFVESISLDGIRERFTSLIHKAPVAAAD